jgi:hypothetical protein
MLKNLISLYSYNYPNALFALARLSNYKTSAYLKQFHKTKNFSLIKHPKSKKSFKKTLALLFLSLGILLQIIIGIIVLILGIDKQITGGIFFGLAIIVIYPLTWPYLIALGLLLREWFNYGILSNQA